MMFAEVFLFELKYRMARPATYVYFLIIFIFSFFLVTSPTLTITGAGGQTAFNAPYVITLITVVLSFAFTIITSAMVSVAIIRDSEHQTEALLFTTPLTKSAYLLGRFSGSVFMTVLLQFALSLGILAGFWTGHLLPWEVAWSNAELLPFNAWHFIQPFLVFGVTNIFITSAFFFMSGALGRNILIIYMQGIVLVVIYQILFGLVGDPGAHFWIAFFDPFAVQTFVYMARYLTPAEQNTVLIPFADVLLYNRVFWIVLACLAIFFTWFKFSFSERITHQSPDKKLDKETKTTSGEVLPNVETVFSFGTTMSQLIRLTLHYFRLIWREPPFKIMVLTGMVSLIVRIFRMAGAYDTSLYATTGSVLEALDSFNFFLLIIVVFYTGELVWRERDLKFDGVSDALPVSVVTWALSKCLAIMLVITSLLALLMLTGVVTQVVGGYNEINVLAYAAMLFGEKLSTVFLFAVPMFLVMLLVPNKFLGFTIIIILVIVRSYLSQLGVEHGMLQYASGTLGTYSDMNGFGHAPLSFMWFRLYWMALAISLLMVVVWFYPRGYQAGLQDRWHNTSTKLKRSLVVWMLAALVVFITTGVFLYNKTTSQNSFEDTQARTSWQAFYERVLKRYEHITQPVIVHTNLSLDLFPSTRSFEVTGEYLLRNNSDKAITTLLVQQNRDPRITSKQVTFNRKTTVEESYDELRFNVVNLDQPLLPGDTLTMQFALTYNPGTLESPGQPVTHVLHNGSLIPSEVLPQMGYQAAYELTGRSLRQRNGLNPTRTTVSKTHVLVTGRFTISTDADQFAVAPGYLAESWQEDDRRFFDYRMDIPGQNQYTIAAARYTIYRDEWEGIPIEVYYHRDHAFNLQRMVEAMKNTLEYCSRNFGPYPYPYLRLVEVTSHQVMPTNPTPGTLMLSEDIAFVSKPGKSEKSIDLVNYLVSHELARQWWEVRLMVTDTMGSRLITHGLTQYTALMAMRKNMPDEAIYKFMRFELDAYLRGRSRERNREQPLALTEQSQAYLYQRKASMAFLWLQDIAGEANLNATLKEFLNTGFKQPLLAKHLLHNLYATTPDSIHSGIKDFFESTVLYENQLLQTGYRKNGQGTFDVILHIKSDKVSVDSAGVEHPITPNDWLDVVVYAYDKSGKETAVYSNRHHIKENLTVISLTLEQPPSRVHIDPMCKYPDKHAHDNQQKPKEFVEFADVLLDF